MIIKTLFPKCKRSRKRKHSPKKKIKLIQILNEPKPFLVPLIRITPNRYIGLNPCEIAMGKLMRQFSSTLTDPNDF